MLHQKESNFPLLSVIYSAGGEASTASSPVAVPDYIYCVIKGGNDPESGQNRQGKKKVPFFKDLWGKTRAEEATQILKVTLEVSYTLV